VGAWLSMVVLLAPASGTLRTCQASDCPGVVYVWTPRMPLSEAGIPNVQRAAQEAGADLVLVAFEELERFAESGVVGEMPGAELAEAMLEAGALAHAPSLVVHEGSRVIGSASLRVDDRRAPDA
jgi:hypothetical protein